MFVDPNPFKGPAEDARADTGLLAEMCASIPQRTARAAGEVQLGTGVANGEFDSAVIGLCTRKAALLVCLKVCRGG